MAFSYLVERNGEEANIIASGVLTVVETGDLFQQITGLIDGGYRINLQLQGMEFAGLGAARSLRIAALRAEHAGVELNLQAGPAIYRIADLIGSERWSPLPSLSLEDDSIPV